MNEFNFTPKLTIDRIKQYLRDGKRFDGRTPEEFREITIENGVSRKAEGSAKVKIGNTEVIVGIKMDVGTPYADSPNKGNLMVTAELTPLSSSRFEAGPPRFSAIEIGRVIDRGLRESKFIDFEKLCIKKGEKVWTVYVDIYSINDDGNLLDAAGIAAIAALKDTRIPEYDEEKGVVLYGELTNKKINLSQEMPIPITVYKVGSKFLADPTREEEDASETRITLGSFNGAIFSIQKGELGFLTQEEFEKSLELNERAWKLVHKKVEKQFK